MIWVGQKLKTFNNFQKHWRGEDFLRETSFFDKIKKLFNDIFKYLLMIKHLYHVYISF